MKQLPAAQLEVMQIIWEAENPVSRTEIQKCLPDNQWKISTLNTLLARLVHSGFLRVEHRGKEYIYTPAVKRDEYMKYAGRSILNSLYGNSIKKFVAAVYAEDELTNQDIKELESLLKELKGCDADD